MPNQRVAGDTKNASHTRAQAASSSQMPNSETTRREFSVLFTERSRLFDPECSGRTITLEESNAWMAAANIFDGQKITESIAKEVFESFRTDGLTLGQYNKFLDHLAQKTGTNADNLRKNLAACRVLEYNPSPITNDSRTFD